MGSDGSCRIVGNVRPDSDTTVGSCSSSYVVSPITLPQRPQKREPSGKSDLQSGHWIILNGPPCWDRSQENMWTKKGYISILVYALKHNKIWASCGEISIYSSVTYSLLQCCDLSHRRRWLTSPFSTMINVFQDGF